MKKSVIIAVMSLAATAASALEVGANVSRAYSTTNQNSAGITLGHDYGDVNVAVGLDHSTVGTNNQNRYSLVGGYNVVKVGDVNLSAKAGIAYLDNQNGPDGYATTVGIGASYPLTKTLAVTADVHRQYGQSRVEQYNGNRVAVGLKQSF